MSDTQSQTPSITDRVRPIETGAPVVGVQFVGETAVLVLGEEALLLADGSGERRVEVHAGGILASAGDGKRVITGGDDGKVMATAADGTTSVIAKDPKSRWIDQVAIGPDRAVAWSAGKTVSVQGPKIETKSLDIPSAAGGLAFAPKGFRIAIAHYNGATLWFPNAAAKPEFFDWKGSHLGVTFSPDGKFLITLMQEAMLHGWRIADRKHMRMSGYTARVRSVAWTQDGDWLATGGSDQLILWPFQSKDGPMGKNPKMLSPWATRLQMVAAHPTQDVVACGYLNGLVMMVRIDDGAEILVRKPGTSPITALAFSETGAHLAFGTEDGQAGFVTF
jgi:WD40 repeat protein